jgi:hypothetical protein
MRAQPGEVREGPREQRADPAMQDQLEPLFLKYAGPRALVEEQAQLGGEANIRERDVIADQILAARR